MASCLSRLSRINWAINPFGDLIHQPAKSTLGGNIVLCLIFKLPYVRGWVGYLRLLHGVPLQLNIEDDP